MRPLFLFCRASGASIKYLYDKTFEMNLKRTGMRLEPTIRRGEFCGHEVFVFPTESSPLTWRGAEPRRITFSAITFGNRKLKR